MNFGFDDNQQELRAAAERLLAKEAAPDVVRAALEDPVAWRSLWDTVVGLGWTSLAVPEALGGLGLGVVDLVALVEIAGRWALPAPLVSTIGLAAPVLLATGADDQALAALAAGTVTTLAAEGAITWDGSRLQGTALRVPDATRAETLVVLADGVHGPTVATLAAADPGVRVEPSHSADPNRPLADVVLDVVVTAVPADPGPGLDAARTVLAAELVGAADRILEMTVAYARDRVQFDRPIGSFQGVKHRLADLFVAVERARTLTYDAAMVLDHAEATPARRSALASLAKAAASEAALMAARVGVQLHGAIAITWEHDLHLFARVARQSSAALGDHLFHYRRAAELFLAEEG